MSPTEISSLKIFSWILISISKYLTSASPGTPKEIKEITNLGLEWALKATGRLKWKRESIPEYKQICLPLELSFLSCTTAALPSSAPALTIGSTNTSERETSLNFGLSMKKENPKVSTPALSKK